MGLLTRMILACMGLTLWSSSEPGREALTWTKKAAQEAEEAAAYSCSGHGFAFLDGIDDEDGRPVCECNTCYSGPDCSQILPSCPADASSGDPKFLEPYWRLHSEGGSVVIPAWHRMGYEADGGPYMTRQLERHVRLLHELVGNAATHDKFIVFGAGSTQLFNAALHALAPDNSSAPALVVATAPYYAAYRAEASYWRSKFFEWKGSLSNFLNSTRSLNRTIIEIVTSPNNPDGRWQTAVVTNAAAVISDHAYYWPHFSAIKAPADDDLSLFTLSKISGHAGSRFGWALIKNKRIYDRMVEHLDTDTMGVSRDTQLRALKLIKEMISQIKKKEDIFRFGHDLIKDRWARLNAVVSSSDRFSLQKLSPEFCNYFGVIRDPSPAYAWLRCERDADVDCTAVMRAGGIIAREGPIYGADARHVRLSLIKSCDDFDQLMSKMKTLTSQ